MTTASRRPLRVIAPALMLIAAAACFTGTSAEDPLPGPVQTAGVFAMPDGAWLVRVSVLLPGGMHDVSPWFTRSDLLSRWLADEVRLSTEPGDELLLRWLPEGEELRGHTVAADLPYGLELELEPLSAATGHRLALRAEDAPGGTRVFLEQWPFAAGSEGEVAADSRRHAWFQALRVLRASYERGGADGLPALPTTPIAPPSHQPARRSEADRSPIEG